MQPTSLLDAISIAAPCHERWASMVGDDEKRHCARCDLDVFNLTAMTRVEAEALLLESERGRVCVRLFRRSDGTVLTRDCPVGVNTAKRRLPLVAAALAGLSAVAGMTASAAAVAMSMTADEPDEHHHASHRDTVRRDPQAMPLDVGTPGQPLLDALTRPFGVVDEIAIARAAVEKTRQIEAAKALEAKLVTEGVGVAIAGGIGAPIAPARSGLPASPHGVGAVTMGKVATTPRGL